MHCFDHIQEYVDQIQRELGTDDITIKSVAGFNPYDYDEECNFIDSPAMTIECIADGREVYNCSFFNGMLRYAHPCEDESIVNCVSHSIYDVVVDGIINELYIGMSRDDVLGVMENKEGVVCKYTSKKSYSLAYDVGPRAIELHFGLEDKKDELWSITVYANGCCIGYLSNPLWRTMGILKMDRERV